MKKIMQAILALAMACGIGVAAVGCGGGEKISVYNREDGSGTRSAFIELLGIDATELIPGAGQFDSTSAVLSAVAGDANGIGYISLGSLDDTVKAVTVEGVAATAQTVADGSYRVARPFELMYQQERYESNDLLRDFVTFLQSAQAQEVLENYGYVSVAENAPAYVAPTEAFETTTLDVGGSTSVQPLMGTDDDGKICLVEAYKQACGQDVAINVQGGGSGTGINNAANGTFDIGMASKEVSEDDFENPTGTMVIYQLCADGIAIIVNTENTIADLTIADLVEIYTGKAQAWTDLSE